MTRRSALTGISDVLDDIGIPNAPPPTTPTPVASPPTRPATNDQRTARISIDVTPHERQALRRYALERLTTVAEIMRSHIDELLAE